jgi:NifU-like protein
MQIVIAALDEMRPYLKADGGDVELVDIDGKNIYVRLSGACSGCQMASVTIEGIQTKLVEKLGELVRVIPHTMMMAE